MSITPVSDVGPEAAGGEEQVLKQNAPLPPAAATAPRTSRTSPAHWQDDHHHSFIHALDNSGVQLFHIKGSPL
jgi:hypothetical protein